MTAVWLVELLELVGVLALDVEVCVIFEVVAFLDFVAVDEWEVALVVDVKL